MPQPFVPRRLGSQVLGGALLPIEDDEADPEVDPEELLVETGEIVGLTPTVPK
jgi:hypothetical protein